MGEIADMMLNGESCEGCGEFLMDDDGNLDGDGIPNYCSVGCAVDRGADWWLKANGYDENGKKLKP